MNETRKIFEPSSSWTLQSNLKTKGTKQGDENEDTMAVPKTDFLRGLSGLMESSATFEVLPHQVFPKPTKRVSIVSSASEADTRSIESDDDDSWIDALYDVPVAMFDTIEPLPVFQDVLPSPSNESRHKRNATDMNIPSIVTPAGGNALRRVSMELFLPTAESRSSTPLKTPTPSAPKKKAPPPPRPSALNNATSLTNAFDSALPEENTFKPSQLFTKKHLAVKKTRISDELSSMKKPPAIKEEASAKSGPKEEPFPNISSSGRVRKSVKIYNPQEYEIPRKPKKTMPAVKQEKASSGAGPCHLPMEPYRKKRKVETPKMSESDPLKNVRIPRKSAKTLERRKSANLFKKAEASEIATSSSAIQTKSSTLKAKKKTKSLKAVKVGRAKKHRLNKVSPLPPILTPSKVKSKNVEAPLKLSEIPKLHKVKKFSDYQEESWDVKYQEFLDFKAHYGHTAVPHYYIPNLKLSRWVKRQRYQYKLRLLKQPSTMTDQRITLLNEAGFIWDSHANVWMERYRELRNYVEKHGHTSVVQKTKSKKKHNCLAAWVKHQRRQYKLLHLGAPSHMTPERMDLLDKIGFKWFIRTGLATTTTTKTAATKTIRTRSRRATEEFKVADLEDIKPDQVGSTGEIL